MFKVELKITENYSRERFAKSSQEMLCSCSKECSRIELVVVFNDPARDDEFNEIEIKRFH